VSIQSARARRAYANNETLLPMHQATGFSDVYLKAAKVILLSHTVLTRWPSKMCSSNENPDQGSTKPGRGELIDMRPFGRVTPYISNGRPAIRCRNQASAAHSIDHPAADARVGRVATAMRREG
jgi:hypothetical protein